VPKLPRLRMTPLRWVVLAVVVMIALTPGVDVLVLHYRSRDPHTAMRQPLNEASHQVNPTIERKAQQFMAALRVGDENTLRALALGADDQAAVPSFVDAFGRRNDRVLSLEPSDLGEIYGYLTIAVPCGDGSTQQPVVVFMWKRTSFTSSSWFAIVNTPGYEQVQPLGCAP